MTRKWRTSLLRRGIEPRLYQAWLSMRERCHNPNYIGYSNDGGRGITVCKRWDSFANFAADMSPHLGKGWSLDRINNDKGYFKSNCRWATRSIQNRNQRRTKVTSEIAAIICGRYKRGRPWYPGNKSILATKFNVSISTINNIVAGVSWQ